MATSEDVARALCSASTDNILDDELSGMLQDYFDYADDEVEEKEQGEVDMVGSESDGDEVSEPAHDFDCYVFVILTHRSLTHTTSVD